MTETTAPSTPTIEILEYGEDGEDLRCRGHVDPQAFLDACDAYVREAWFTSPEPTDLPSGWSTEPTHTWWRPYTAADVRANLERASDMAKKAGWTPVEITDEVIERNLGYMHEEEWRLPCDADHPDAQPYTRIRA